MKRLVPLIALLTVSLGCGEQTAPHPDAKGGTAAATGTASAANQTLAEARRGFVTKPGPLQPPGEPAPQPPPDLFQLVKYSSPVGELSAYITPDPGDSRQHPAIIWITGGDCNTIGNVWEPAPRSNDQTAAAYREAGIVMMFPSLRGGNDNPGRREGFLGEVEDVLAAADYLAAQPYVDPTRIYLGGHSTGGTLVMLVAEMSDRFRAVFAFGPVGDVRAYGGQFVYHAPGDTKESLLRSPAYWLDSVRSPLFVIEGTGGNIESLREMRPRSTNPLVQFVEVPGADHFDVLAPANEAIAAKILGARNPEAALCSTKPAIRSDRACI